MSINAINTQFAAFNPLQHQGAAPAFGAAQQVANPFATNPLGQQANAFSSFGAPQGAQDAPLDPALLQLLQGNKTEEKKEESGIGEILKLVMSLIGQGDKSEASDEVAEEAAPAEAAASSCASGECGECVYDNQDGVCDTGCPDGSCG